MPSIVENRVFWKPKQPSPEEASQRAHIHAFLRIFHALYVSDVTFAEMSVYREMGVDASAIRRAHDLISSPERGYEDPITRVKRKEFKNKEKRIEKNKQRFETLRQYVLEHNTDPQFQQLFAEEILEFLEYGEDKLSGTPINIGCTDLLISFILEEEIEINIGSIFTEALAYLARDFPPNLHNAQVLFEIAERHNILIDADNQYLKNSWARAVQRSVSTADVDHLQQVTDFLSEHNIKIDYLKESHIIEACRTCLSSLNYVDDAIKNREDELRRFKEEQKADMRLAYQRYLGLNLD